MEKCIYNEVTHTFKPVFNKDSRILILGTMPSVKSRAENFYYMHPQNLFWKVISSILGRETPETAGEKKKMLLDNHIALWDVLQSCEIEGSSDSSIRKPIANDITPILKNSGIRAVFTNGTKATELYRRYIRPSAGIDCIPLPSTSPANRKYHDTDSIYAMWSKILDYL